MIAVIEFAFGLFSQFFITLQKFVLFDIDGVEVTLFSLMIGLIAFRIILQLLSIRGAKE